MVCGVVPHPAVKVRKSLLAPPARVMVSLVSPSSRMKSLVEPLLNVIVFPLALLAFSWSKLAPAWKVT